MTPLNSVKYEQVAAWFHNHPRILVALSGGVDSCLAAFLARKILGRQNVVAIIGDSPSLKRKDYNQALDFCHQHDIKHYTVNPGEINDPRYNQNPEDRCFWCKNSLYITMGEIRDNEFEDFEIINGNNKSDLGDYRPGMKAANQYRVLSPLADCEFEKNDIREMALHFGLKEWDKPASPCLSSRFPYGQGITVNKLRMVEAAEDILNQKGFKDVRARYRSGGVSIEVPPAEVEQLEQVFADVSHEFQKLGFKEVQIDREGLVSGKLNREIGKSRSVGE